MTQYLACKFRPTDSRTYTYSWDGEEPLAVGDKVTVASPRDEGNITVEVAAIVPKPSFPTSCGSSGGLRHCAGNKDGSGHERSRRSD